MLGVVARLGWREPDPEAVVQQVWLRVLASAHTFSGRAAVPTRLHRISVNEAISAARRRRATRTIPTGQIDDLAEVRRLAVGCGMGRVVDRAYAAAVLPGLLSGLPREQRLALEVVYLDGPTQAEAAQLFGVATGTIKSRLSRAQAAELAARHADPDPAAASPGNR
ncbi:RNA polymerase sigma factor [Actinomycetospora straminea]|uniref:RNA polymerase sigma factor n=1 Tax=Actinomycetospora straminea TaxID=663607 RepID=UPI0030823543